MVQFDNLCEVQSDKAAVTITSRYDGTIKKLWVFNYYYYYFKLLLSFFMPNLMLSSTYDSQNY